jgi:hypothetical protein
VAAKAIPASFFIVASLIAIFDIASCLSIFFLILYFIKEQKQEGERRETRDI